MGYATWGGGGGGGGLMGLHLGVCQELEDDPTPAGVPGEGVVELRGDLSQAVELGVGDLGEVVVLVVIAHIVGQRVQGPIVGVRLLTLLGELGQTTCSEKAGTLLTLKKRGEPPLLPMNR